MKFKVQGMTYKSPGWAQKRKFLPHDRVIRCMPTAVRALLSPDLSNIFLPAIRFIKSAVEHLFGLSGLSC